MNKEEWANWRASPTTVKFFKFLSDYREAIAKELALAVSVGTVPTQEDVLRTAKRCDAISEIEELVAEDIIDFYEPEKEGEDDGEETEEP